MTLYGVTVSGGTVSLGTPEELSLSWDRGVPADVLRATVSGNGARTELREVLLKRGDETLFRGVVDEQSAALTKSGVKTGLICRSREALLLDSEACPGIWSAPSLEMMERRLLADLGLSLGGGDRSVKRGSFTISKGESRWTALSRFCAQYLGTAPTVDLAGRVQCGGVPAGKAELSHVTAAKLELLPCKRLSGVWQQSSRGGYDTLFKNGGASLPRLRYVSMESGRDPRELLAQGEDESFSLTVTCAGDWWQSRNGRASVTAPGLGRFEDCPVQSVRYFLDGGGERTKLVLSRPGA